MGLYDPTTYVYQFKFDKKSEWQHTDSTIFLHIGTSNMHQNKQLCVTNVL